LVNGLVLDALEAARIARPAIAQVSELAKVHASWVEPRLTAYSAGTEEVRAALLRHGAPAESIRVLGLPVGPGFGRVSEDRHALRASLGLEPSRFTALALGGGEGAGGLNMAVEALLDSGLDVQLIVVCGRNSSLRRRLERVHPAVPMRVFGYVDDVHRLMAAADVVITKGGPQSIAEALASGRPVLVTSCLPGQEEGNDRLVERWGVGYHVPTQARVVAMTARLALDDPTYASVSSAVAQRARPDAAVRVAEWALALSSTAVAS
jgi:UDP-N-acetylglucosamine:LPS N-acetylglucosamine transferase